MLRDAKGVFPDQSDQAFLPAGQQVELILKSEDRVAGSSLNDAYFYISPAVPGVQSISLGWFSMYNLFPNITATRLLSNALDNVLAVTATGAVPAQVVFPEGRYQSGFGRVTNTMVRADPYTATNDVRYFLIRSYLKTLAADDVLLAATLDPITGFLTLEWNPTYVASTPITVNPAAGSLWYQLGFASTTSATSGTPTWQGVRVLNLGDPLSVALQSQIGQITTNSVYQSGSLSGSGNVSGAIQSSRTNYVAIVPITAPPYSISLYEPFVPIAFSTLRNSRPLSDVRVQIINPVTGQFVPMSSSQNWQLKLVLNIVD